MAAGTRHALLIGVGRYDDPRMPALSAPTRDVEELGRVLRERGGFAVTTSLDEDFAAVRDRVMDLTEGPGRDDTILLFYSGHGQRDFSGRLYLTTRRSNPANPKRGGIEAAFVQDQLAQCRASRKVVVLDCCYSGAFDETAGGLRKDGPDGPMATLADFESAQGAGTFVLMATEGGQTAPGDPTAEGTSRFTSLLLRGLRGDAAPDEEEITAQHLAAFAEREAPRELGIQPRSSTRQAHGRLVLVRNPSAGSTRLPKDVLEGLTSPSVLTRIGSIWRLGKLAQNVGDPPCAGAAKRVLEARLHQDDGEQDHRARVAVQEVLDPSPATPPGHVAALAEVQSARNDAEAMAAALSLELATTKKILSDALEKLTRAERERESATTENQRLSSSLSAALLEIERFRAIEQPAVASALEQDSYLPSSEFNKKNTSLFICFASGMIFVSILPSAILGFMLFAAIFVPYVAFYVSSLNRGR